MLDLKAALKARKKHVDKTGGHVVRFGTGSHPVFGSGAGSKGRVSGKFNGVDFDVKSSTGAAGLVNQGALCYLDSVLQTWFHTPEFRRAVYDWK